MQSPSASPSPILVQLIGAGDAAPWWGVPAVAGAFLLLGGYLTYLFNRANEKRRIEVERDNALTEELMESAAELIALGRQFSALGQKVMVTSLPLFFPEFVKQSTDLIGQHTVLYNRVRLVMPQRIQKVVLAYSAACIALTMAPFDRTSMNVRLDLHTQTEQDLVNALRKLRGLTDLETTDARNDQRRKEHFADRAAAEMTRALEEHGVSPANDVDEQPRDTGPGTTSTS